MSDDAYKEKIYKYYLWLDEMIMEHWSEYIDLLVTGSSIETCDNKIKMIEFYQRELESLSGKVTFAEVYEWRNKQRIKSATQIVCDSIFPEDI